MTATALLADLHARGFALTVDGDRLTVSPASRLTDDDRAAIRTHKPELIALLEAGPRWSESGRFWWCSCGPNVSVMPGEDRCPLCGVARPARREGAA